MEALLLGHAIFKGSEVMGRDPNVAIKVSEVILDWFYTAVKLNQLEFDYAISVS